MGRSWVVEPRAVEMWNRVNLLGAELTQANLMTLPAGLRHPAYLMRFHNAVMSGGVAFAAEVTDESFFAAVQDASRYFGLPGLTELLERVARVRGDDDALGDLGDEYMRVTEEDVTGQALIDRALRQSSWRVPTTSTVVRLGRG